MEFSKDFFKILQDKSFDAFERARKMTSRLYARLVVRGEYTRRDLAVLFVAASFVGIGLKTVAVQVITIGYEDYTLPPKETLMSLNAVQEKMIANGSAFIGSGVAPASVCSQ